MSIIVHRLSSSPLSCWGAGPLNFTQPDLVLTSLPFLPADPQTWKEWTRARNADEYLHATEQLCASMTTLSFPFVCFHGEVDTMTDPEGSKKLFADSKV